MRHRRFSTCGAAFAALILFGSLLPGGAALGDALFKQAGLTIDTKNGPVVLHVEVADIEPKRQQGLMFRRKLDADRGMIFLFDYEQEITMWMKNTYIPLDMVFIGDDWRIVHIAENAEPLSTDIIPSIRPASRVLEIAGGQAKKLGLAAGDRVGLKQ